MTVRLVVEMGSNFAGNFEPALEFVRQAKTIGAWALKGQLFPEDFGDKRNIPFPEDWIAPLVAYGKDAGIKVFFSTFGSDSKCGRYMNYLYGLKVDVLKIAFLYRKRLELIKDALELFNEVIVSTSVMDKPLLPEASHLTTLYCHSINGEAVYPVVDELNFAGLFDEYGFDGLSSHCLDIGQVGRAINSGAKIVEVHAMLDDQPRNLCPDAHFSIRFKELAKLGLKERVTA